MVMFKKFLCTVISLHMILSLYGGVVSCAQAQSLYWNFNNQTLPPNTQLHSTPASSYATPGPLGGTDNYSFRFNLPSAGSATTLSRGFRWLPGDTSYYVNDKQFVFQASFMVANTFVYASLIDPRFGESSKALSAGMYVVYIKDGTVYCGDVLLATVEANEWFTVGALLTMSSSAGTTMDVYFNGEMVLKGLTDDVRTDGLNQFRTIIGSTCTSEAYQVNNRYDNRNERIYIDDLYMTEDVDMIKPEFKLISSAPSDEEIDVMPTDKITLNFSQPVSEFSDAFTISNAEIDEIVYNDDTYKSLTIILTEFLNNKTNYTVTIDPQKVISNDARSYSGATSISFRVGEFEKVISHCEYYLLENDEQTQITQIQEGEIRAELSATALSEDITATAIGLVCKGTEECYKVKNIQIKNLLFLQQGIPKQISFDFHVDSGEFLKIFLWEVDENSLTNISLVNKL